MPVFCSDATHGPLARVGRIDRSAQDAGVRADHVVPRPATNRATVLLIETDSISLIGPNWSEFTVPSRNAAATNPDRGTIFLQSPAAYEQPATGGSGKTLPSRRGEGPDWYWPDWFALEPRRRLGDVDSERPQRTRYGLAVPRLAGEMTW